MWPWAPSPFHVSPRLHLWNMYESAVTTSQTFVMANKVSLTHIAQSWANNHPTNVWWWWWPQPIRTPGWLRKRSASKNVPCWICSCNASENHPSCFVPFSGTRLHLPCENSVSHHCTVKLFSKLFGTEEDTVNYFWVKKQIESKAMLITKFTPSRLRPPCWAYALNGGCQMESSKPWEHLQHQPPLMNWTTPLPSPLTISPPSAGWKCFCGHCLPMCPRFLRPVTVPIQSSLHLS